MSVQIPPRIDAGDFAPSQGDHDCGANLYYKKYVIYSYTRGC
jgi:hypothetical protein